MPKYNRILSKIPDLEKLALYPLPTRPIVALKAVRYESTYVIQGKDGKIYTSQASSFLYWARTTRFKNTIICLIRLNLLTQKAIDQHYAIEEAENSAREKRYACKTILEHAKSAGIKLTVAQQSKLVAGAK